MQKNKKRIIKYLSFILIAICFSISILTATPLLVNSAYALDTTGYSDVLKDLQKDDRFNIDDYPSVADDYSLKVIQIAESTGGELFVYVYQPSAETKELVATTINISTGIETLSYINYKLTQLSANGVFAKYRVDDLLVKTDVLRKYDISSIFRAWDKSIDEEPSGGNTISEVSFNVGQQWTATTYNNQVLYSNVSVETIEITNKYVGFVRYESDNNNWHSSACDRHFVAFNTDKPIDKLLEADVYYLEQSMFCNYLDNTQIKNNKPFTKQFGNKVEKYSYLTYTDRQEVEVGSSGLIGNKKVFKYAWDKIQNVNDFVSSVNVGSVYSRGIFDTHVQSKITQEGLNDLGGMQWVLSFVNTDYSFDMHATGGGGSQRSSIVGDVTILRLKFETDGIVYDLGVVDNKQTGDGIQDNVNKVFNELTGWFKIFLIILATIFGLLLIVVIVVVLTPFAPIFKAIFNAIGKFIKGILKVVWWVISSPFELLKSSKKG